MYQPQNILLIKAIVIQKVIPLEKINKIIQDNDIPRKPFIAELRRTFERQLRNLEINDDEIIEKALFNIHNAPTKEKRKKKVKFQL